MTTDPALAQIHRNMTNHTPTAKQIGYIEGLRGVAKDLGESIVAACPPCRERSLAITHLEDAVMRAVQAIVIHDEDGNPR